MPAVAIEIAATDYFDRTLFSSARFMSQVNGAPGECYLRLRDPDRTLDFAVGSEILLTIDGEAVWRGFLMQQKRVFVFPALNVDAFGETRFLDLIGVDINVLFTKRIVFNQATPELVQGRLYPPHTADNAMIADLVADFLDLSSDTIDTGSFVDHVGDSTVDQEGRAWQAGDTWGQAMGSIAMLPAAIFYLRPTLTGSDLVYCDVDTPNAPYAMSDIAGQGVGYREMEILKDGTGLINDQLAWGIGYGSNVPVFVRDQDAASQAEHGLWQAGTVRYGIYKQGTINRVAASIVDGSPQSKRGAKNDRPSVTVSTYQTGFLPSQKIDFTSEVWGFNDVIPIRKMEVTFEAPDNPKYALTLSHEIDAPFGMIDPFFINYSLPPFPSIPPFPPFPLPDACTPAICGITDDFNRTEASDLGTATCTLPWATAFVGSGSSVSVNGSEAVIFVAKPSSSTPQVSAALGPGSTGYRSPTFDITAVNTLRFRIDGDIVGAETGFELIWTPMQIVGVSPGPNILIGGASSRIRWATGISGTAIPAVFWNAASHYTWTVFHVSGSTWRTSVTDGVDTYSYDSGIATPTYAMCGLSVNITGGASAGHTVWIDSIDIPDITRCTLNQLDNFDRVEASDWGTSSSDIPWTLTTSSNADASVDAAGIIALNSSAGSAQVVNEASAGSGQWWNNPSFDLTARFSTDNVANTGRLRFLFFEGTFATFRGVDLLMADGLISLLNATGSTDAPYTGWADGDDMNVHFQVEAGVAIRARVWHVEDAEPTTWNVELTDTDATTVPTFRVETDDNSDVTDSVVLYSNIQIDWSGKPCYGSCGALDTFDDRDIPDGYLAGWGKPSGYTVDWAEDIAFGLVGLPITGVFDGVGFLAARGDASVPTGPFNGGTRMSLYGVPATMDTFTALVEFYPGAGPASRTWSFQFGPVMVFGNRLDPPNGVDYGQVDIYVLDGTTHQTFAVSNPQDNMWFVNSDIGGRLKVWWDGNTAHIKLWDADLPEPVAWLWEVGRVAPIVIDPTIQGCVRCRLDSILLKSDQTVALHYADVFFVPALFVNFIEFDCVLPGPGSVQTNPSGFGCETPTRLSSTTFQCSASMVAGSSRVFVNGLRQRGGIALDYTESTAASGTIVFADPVAVGADVSVCYTSAGPIGGGS